MAVLALVLFTTYMGVGFVLRTVLHLRHTGDSGFRGLSGRPGSADWWAGVLFVAALVAAPLGPVADLAGLPPLDALHHPALQVAATVVTVAGIVATLLAQLAMGASWRIGVDPDERTQLVTTGPFAVVRNPIFSAMALTGVGLAFMVSNAVTLVGAALLIVALHLQVRVVEEPYLLATHGRAFEQYAARTGRFVPGLGRLTPRPN